MIFLKALLPITLLLITSVINADEINENGTSKNKNVKYGVQVALADSYGGDTILTDSNIRTIKAGNNYSIGIYVEKSGLREELIPALLYPLSGKIALNYITESDEYVTAEEGLRTFSIDILPMLEIIDTVHVGAGLTYHLNPSYEFIYTDNSGHEKIEYGPALGLILQAKKVFDDKFQLALTYTYIEYSGTAENDNLNNFHVLETLNASNLALSFALIF